MEREMTTPTYKQMLKGATMWDETHMGVNSGVWGPADEFYTAINGSLVHKSDDIPDEWAQWKAE